MLSRVCVDIWAHACMHHLRRLGQQALCRARGRACAQASKRAPMLTRKQCSTITKTNIHTHIYIYMYIVLDAHKKYCHNASCFSSLSLSLDLFYMRIKLINSIDLLAARQLAACPFKSRTRVRNWASSFAVLLAFVLVII